MIHKSLELITTADILKLISDGIDARESLRIEYKRELPGRADKDKKEFLADVSSFANASGGDLIFGVSAKDGVPSSMVPLVGLVPDQEELRLEGMIRTGIAPRIPGIQFRTITNGVESCMLLRIPQSWAGPHMVTLEGHSKFFSRSNAGKYQLDVAQIGAAFVGSHETRKWIEDWKNDRIGRVAANEGPMPLSSGASLILHVAPLSAYRDRLRFSGKDLGEILFVLPPRSGGNSMYNIDGWLCYHPSGKAYVQVFRSGCIEGVITDFLYVTDSGPQISVSYIQETILDSAKMYIDKMNQAGIDPPFIVMVTLCGVKGVIPTGDSRSFRQMSFPISQQVVCLPELIVENTTATLASELQPIFNILLNAAGAPGTPSH